MFLDQFLAENAQNPCLLSLRKEEEEGSLPCFARTIFRRWQSSSPDDESIVLRCPGHPTPTVCRPSRRAMHGLGLAGPREHDERVEVGQGESAPGSARIPPTMPGLPERGRGLAQSRPKENLLRRAREEWSSLGLRGDRQARSEKRGPVAYLPMSAAHRDATT